MKTMAFFVIGVVTACSSDPVTSNDAGPDASIADAAKDTSFDALPDSSMDASMDAAADANDGGLCKPDAGASCFQCCDSQIPNTKDAFRAVLSNCMPTNCSGPCATELMSQPPYPPPTPGSACEKCVFGLVDAGSSCVKQMKMDCGVQMSCVNFVTCMDDCVRR